MSPETTICTNATDGQSRLERAGTLMGLSAILVSASAAMAFSGQYPVTDLAGQSASSVRDCTQIELAAKMLPGECGTLTLSDVVVRMNALQEDDQNE